MARRRSTARRAHASSQPSADTAARTGRFVWHLVLIAGVAFTVRLIYILEISRSPFFDVLIGDARRYDAWASQIAAGDWLGGEVFYQAPLYPYVIGVIYSVAGRSLMTVRVVQAALGAASCVLLALAARRLFSERAAAIAGLGLAVYAPAIFFAGLLQKSALDLFFVSLLLWLLSGAGTSAYSLSRWIVVGVVLGALTLTRENGLVFAIPILVCCLWPSSRPLPERLRRASAFLFGVALVLLPVAARNAAIGGEFHLTTAQFGPNFYIGNNPQASGTYAALREGRESPEFEQQDATELAEAAIGRRLTPAEVSTYWTRRATDFITAQPTSWLTLTGRKILLLASRTEVVDTEGQESYEEWSTLLRALAPIGHFGVLVPLALLGMLATRDRRGQLTLYYGLMAAYSASVLMFYVSARYRLPLVPFLIVFGAAGLASLPSAARAASTGTRVAAILLVIAAVVITNRTVLSNDLQRAMTETNLGAALQTGERFAEAEGRYRRAIAIKPDYAPAHVNLGTVLVLQNRLDDAIDAFTRARQLGSNDPELPGRLGYALVRAGRNQEAIAVHRAAVARTPNNSVLRFALGTLLLDQQQYAEAVEHFRAGLALAPQSAEARNNLGFALAQSGKIAEAIPEFEEAIRLNPNLADARRNLEVARGK